MKKLIVYFSLDGNTRFVAETIAKEIKAKRSMNTVMLGVYNNLVGQGIAPEMARMVLPQSMMTKWIWSGNLLAFIHVCKERLAEGAQHEAKLFALQLSEILKKEFPISYEALMDVN